jgi:hypothetical protein
MKVFLIFFIAIVSSHSLSAQERAINNELLISQHEVRQIIKNIIYELDNLYLYPEKTKNLHKTLTDKLSTKGFLSASNLEDFRHELISTLVNATHDTGFDIVQRQPIILSRIPDNKENSEQTSKGAIDAEVLDNNIGYLKITGNITFSDSEQIFLNEFKLLSDVDAMMIDLRLADEVSISLVQRLISYFIPADTLIGNIMFKEHTFPLTSLKVQGYDKFNKNFPLYILNSNFVAGEWELLSHTLKHFDRAVVIGEETMGLGYFTKTVKVSDKLLLKIPYALISHPVSNETWDNSGVTPDYFATDDEIMEKAYELVLAHLSGS